ncbi:hypothetical protein DICVIV_01327 [Dictyocaulus viviparus]|uniref:Uncharacterized protein n=1 Tax=Dictyocaulus viviparus TaxID=29172 RepID=A0A0D8YD14_DICVI|nr:hypothetical protein DICVIV_01327 [Dictyocaulus viviparus]
MTSQSDEENEVHPLVSNLLGQKFIPRTGQVLRYDREEMIRLSTTPLSMQRPDNLSVDFDGDDGKFSPFKWLEYRWEVEGIKNRAPAKKLQDALSTVSSLSMAHCLLIEQFAAYHQKILDENE